MPPRKLMVMVRVSTILASFAALGSIGSRALAQAGSADAGFVAWFAEISAEDGASRATDGLRPEFQARYLDMPSLEEIAEMRRRVDGKPEHPDRRRLANAERMAAGKNLRVASVWRSGSAWRLNQTLEDGYSDLAWSDSGAWILSPRQLTRSYLPLADEKTLAFRAYATSTAWETGLLLNGGLAMSKAALTTRLEGEVWSAEGSAPADATGITRRWSAKGRWSQSGPKTIEESVTTEIGPDDTPVGRMLLQTKDWVPLPIGSQWIARTARVTVNGRPTHEVTLTGCGTVSQAEFRALMTPPSPPPNGVDPIRGPVTYQQLVDERPDRIRQEALATGEILAAPIPEGSALQSLRLRVAGWIAAAGIVAFLVFIKLRRQVAE